MYYTAAVGKILVKSPCKDFGPERLFESISATSRPTIKFSLFRIDTMAHEMNSSFDPSLYKRDSSIVSYSFLVQIVFLY